MNKGAQLILKWTARVGISLWVTTIFFHSPGVHGDQRVEFHELVYGQSWRPFVTRALFPAIVRVISQVIPSSFDAALEKNEPVSRVLSKLKWQAPFLRQYFVAFILSALCLVFLSLTMEALWKAVFRPATPQAYLFSIIGLLGLPVCFIFHSYIYDFPSLLLYTLCILLIARRLWGWYFIAFALSSLSKETSVLLIFVFALYFVRCAATERRTYWGFICVQCLIFLVTRGAIEWVFRGNPGSTVELHFVGNFSRLMNPWSLHTFVVWGLLAALFFRHYTLKPWLLRVAAGMIVPLVVLCFFFGLLQELRDYYEVYVPIAALLGYSVCSLLGCQIETIAPINASSVPCIRRAAHASR